MILNIPQCDHTFLIIYNGPNDTSPLLGKYCGENATAGMEIRSSTNHLFIVGNSGSYGSRLKSVFDFHADYNSEHAEGLFLFVVLLCYNTSKHELSCADSYICAHFFVLSVFFNFENALRAYDVCLFPQKIKRVKYELTAKHHT